MDQYEGMASSVKNRLLLIVSLLFIFLTGCLPTYVIDDIRLVQALGYDAVSKNRVMGTVAVPNFSSSGSQQTQSQNVQSSTDSFSVISNTGKTVPFKLQAKSQEPLRLGKLNVILFNEQLAKRGVEQFVDFFNRDPDIGRQLYIAVVQGKASGVLKGRYSTGTAVPGYLKKMIEQNTERNLPETNLHDFLYAYFGNGIDPFLPLIKKTGDHIEITGLAIFKTNKMVTAIPFDQSFIFKMMYQPFTQGNYEVRVARNSYVSVENIGSKVDYVIEDGGTSHPKITINVKMQGVIREAESDKKSATYSQKVTKVLDKELRNKANKMIKQFQKENVDPLGLGDRVRSKTRNWDFSKWQQSYPHARIHVSVKVDIAQTGITS